MAASANDYFQKKGAGTVTTLSAPGKALGATSINVGSTANYPTDTGITIAIRTVDTAGELVAGTYTEWTATVASGTAITIAAAPVYGSDQIYAAGSTTQVFIPLSSSSHNRMVDGLLVSHDQTGKLLGTAASFVGTAGDIGGAWKSYTPTLSGRLNNTKWDKTCYYTQIGKTVICSVKLKANTTTPMDGGTSGATISLPITAATNYIYAPNGQTYFFDNGGADYYGFTILGSSTTIGILQYRVYGSDIGNFPISATAPFTWDNGDEIYASFTYEAA